VRRRLRGYRDLSWPEAVAAWRQQLGEVERAMEQVEQLLLEAAVGKVDDRAAGAGAIRHNLAALGLGRLLASAELDVLLGTATGSDGREP
jgi:hypothetical protein